MGKLSTVSCEAVKPDPERDRLFSASPKTPFFASKLPNF
jgi:hypothetical protein